MVISSGAGGVYIPQYTNTANSKGVPLHPNLNNNATSQSITQQSKQATTENTDNLMTTRTQIVAGVILTILLLAAVGSAIGYSLKSNNRNDSTTTLFYNTTLTTATTTSTTTTTTTTAPASTICSAVGVSAILYNNQYIYSPSQLYAAGMRNNQFGVYVAYTNGNVTSTSLWLCPQSSTPSGASFAAQSDRNLVAYTSTGGVLWTSNTFVSGMNAAFCLQMLDSGNLIWTDSVTIYWQTNTSG